MAAENNCSVCLNLRSTLIEKEAEINQLKIHIQNLSNFLLCKDKDVAAKTNFPNEFSGDQINQNDVNPQFYMSDLYFKTCSMLDKHIVFKSQEVQTENNGYVSADFTEKKIEVSQPEVGNLHDYVYDKTYQMYYSLTTGYYYDEKSGLMYEPHSRTYYRYNYDTKEYEKALDGENINSSINKDPMDSYTCESVVDQVSNLNLNDELVKPVKVVSEAKDISTKNYESSCNENDSENNSTSDKILEENTGTDENNENSISLGCAKDWQPTEGSELTVTDMVRQVVEEHNNMSDYVYDETYKMYYSPSTGYYFDSVRQLLYDPTQGNYYFYDADTQTYEFYCQTNSCDTTKDALTIKQNSLDKQKLVSRKKYWKNKLKHSQMISEAPDLNYDSNDDENKKSEASEAEFSSPEDGEIFSSDSDSECLISIAKPPVKGLCANQKGSDESYPPSIRAIVENSENLQIGSLILITCTGGIIGRDKTHAVCMPDICVSKMHAEIKYDSDCQTYSIEDLGSQNGTFINDKRLSEPKIKSEPHTLNHGDKLSLGSSKLLLHIHEGHDTCDSCEPGQVLAEISANSDKSKTFMSKEEKEKLRREELQRLKKKYGLKGANFEKKSSSIPKGYEDKAKIRRDTVGSDNPYEKTVTASLDVSVSETNKGYQMLKKMGWKEGQTLGSTESGLVEPIPLRPWTSKAGLGSSTENTPGDLQDKRTKKWVKAQERYFQLSLSTGTS